MGPKEASQSNSAPEPPAKRSRTLQQHASSTEVDTSEDQSKLQALVNATVCTDCEWTSPLRVGENPFDDPDGSKGCQTCMGKWYPSLRLTKTNLQEIQWKIRQDWIRQDLLMRSDTALLQRYRQSRAEGNQSYGQSPGPR